MTEGLLLRRIVGGCVLACVMYAHLASAGTIFRDTFNDGDAEDGMPVTWVPVSPLLPGIYDASSGDYVLETIGPGFTSAASGVPAVVLSDTSIRTQVRLLASTRVNDSLGVLARANRNDLRSYHGAIDARGWLFVNLTYNGEPFLDTISTDLRPLQEDVLLQLDVMGHNIKLWAWRLGEPMPQAPQINVDDTALSAGEPVVTVNQFAEPVTRSVFRFVHVADAHIPEPELADVNLDGEVDGLDVDPFVDVLLDGQDDWTADMNQDGVVNGLDVDPFVAAVVGGGTQPVPEPSTLLLCIVALGVVGGWRKWGG
jgi:hypothetical protein